MAPWNISNALFSKSFQLSVAPTSAYQDIVFRDDGVKMFVLTDGSGFTPNLSILREFDLSIPWDISTATLTNTETLSPENGGIFFKPDGTKMFLTNTTDGEITRYSLSTPWDISTLTQDSGKLVLFEDFPSDIFIRSDGRRMFFAGFEDGEISEYSLSPAWSILGAVRIAVFNVSPQDNTPNGLWFKPDGTKMFVCGSAFNNPQIHEYDLSTPWSILTAVFTQSIPVGTEDTRPAGVTFRNDNGLQMFFVGDTNEKVYAYILGVDKEFSVGAKLVNEVIEFDMGARLIVRNEEEFFIGARLVLFCDNIDTDAGWITTNGGTELLVDDVSFPNVIHFESLAGGGGVTERWTRKDTLLNLSGDVKLEFKFDFQSMKPSGTQEASEFKIFLQEDVIHPDITTGSKIGCILAETIDNSHHLHGEVNDGTTMVTSIQGGNFNQRTTHVYPNIGVDGGVESSVLGPYFITVELKDSKFRMSIFLDESKTIHARGSPREVDATGINPTNLRYLTISNSKGASATLSLLTGDIDSIYITKNEPLPPLSVNTQPATLIEDWESYAEFTQNPDGWFGETELGIRPNNEFNVSSAIFNQSVSLPTILNTGGLYIKKDTGDKMWIINSSAKTIALFNLPTPFSLTGAVFADLASIEAGTGGSETPVGFDWKDNGFRIYTIDSVLSQSGINNNLKEWSTSTGAFDIFGALIFVKEENTRDELNEGKTVGVNINPLGTRLYIVSQATTASDITNGWTNGIHQYNMDIQPFNIANRGLIVGSLAIGDGLTDPREMWMSDDGLKLIVIGNNQINEYDLGTAFEINTAVFASSRFTFPAITCRGVSMKPDGLKMFISDASGGSPEQIFEFDILPVVPPLIDIREVSTEQPNGGIKSFKLHAKFKGDGTGNSMRTSVIGKRIATLPNPDGGELLIPYKFTAKARSEIMDAVGPSSSARARGGVYITYELVQGAPFGSAGTGFTMFKDEASTPFSAMVAFNDIISEFSVFNPASPQTDSPEGSYFTLESSIKTGFQNDVAIDGGALDFESHVKSISIGYWLDLFSQTLQTNDVEAFMYGDEINLIPELVKQHEFKTNAILFETITKEKEFITDGLIKALGQEEEFRANAFLKAFGQEHEFFVGGLIGVAVREHEFRVSVVIVNRHAQNGTKVTARLIALGQEEEFRVNGLIKALDQEHEFFVNAVVGERNLAEFRVNGLIKAFGQEHEFFINALVGEINEEEFRVNGLIKAFGQITDPSTFIVNALLKAFGQELEFRVNAILFIEPTKEDFEIDAILGFSEPQSILTVESVIGHKTGLQT